MKLDQTMNLGTGLVLRKTAVQQNADFKKISDTYSEHAKLVFLFDVSGSMNSRITRDKSGATYTDEFLWPDLNDIKKRVEAVRANLGCDVGNDEDDTTSAALDPESLSIAQLLDPFTGLPKYTTDDELKEQIIKNSLMSIFNVLPDFTKKHQEPPTRIGIVKKLAKQEINARFAKFPNSRIAVIPFSGIAAPLFDDGKQEDIDAAIEKLDVNLRIEHKNKDGIVSKVTYMDGGTDILAAIHEGMDVCRRAPSAVGIHHLIVVTDGGAGVWQIVDWIDNMKASGIVLDYIHIGDETPNKDLVDACKALGGDCVSVNTEKDLKEKFMAAVSRPMLPPASVK